MGAFLDEFLVNEKQQQPTQGGSFLHNFLDEELRQASIVPPKPPSNWFGEATAGVARGVDELQQMGYGAGALASSWLGAEGAKDWFIKGYLGNEKEIQANPASVPSFKDINGIDSAVRYALASVGELSPMIAESVITGGIGSLAALSETTVGTVAKSAVRKLVSGEARQGITPAIKSELSSYLEGAISREALSPLAKEFATKEASALASKYGADAAIAISSIAKESGGIYGDLLADPDIAESDRRVAATVGGIIAAIPDTAVQGWLVGKFFPGVAKEQVTKAMAADASGYLARFASKAAPEVAKVTAAEGGQETIQTIVELASKNWADPAKRYDFLNFTPEQWTEVIDSGLKGAIGGGAFGGTIATVAQMRTQHPNPEVRSDMRTVLQKADDVKLPHPESTPEHDELSNLEDQIQAKQIAIQSATPEAAAAIQAELDPLQTRAEELSAKLFPTQPDLQEGVVSPTPKEPTEPSLVNQKQDEVVEKKTEPVIEKTPVPLSSPDEKVISDLRAFYAQQMASGEVYTPVTPEETRATQLKRAQVDTHLNAIASTNPEYLAKLQSVFTPNVVNMMAKENVSLVTKDDSHGFQVDWGKNGAIELYIPTPANLEQQGKDLGEAVGAKSARAIVANTEGSITHELGHVFDFINIRNDWNASDKSQTIKQFSKATWENRGRIVREASEHLPTLFKAAYQWGKKGKLTDEQLGQEIPRMMFEMARTGKLSEATDALIQAEQANGKLGVFLKTWMDALRKAGEWLKRFIDPATSNPELLKAYDAINRTADKYGILVNQNRKQKGNSETVRFYHGGVPGEGGRWATPDLEYAKGYAAKTLGGIVQYVDIPKDHPLLKKAFDDTGTSVTAPYISFETDDEIAKGFKTLNETSTTATPAVSPNSVVPVGRNPVTESLANQPNPKTSNPYTNFVQTAKAGNQADTVNAWLDWKRAQNNPPTTKSELKSSLVDLNSRLKTTISQKEFNKIVKERNQKNETETTSQPAKKAGITEPAPDDEQRPGILQPEQRGTERYQHGIVKVLEEKAQAAGNGKRIAAIREYLETKHPWLTTHFDNIVREVQSYRTVDPEAISRLTAIPAPMRGEQVARDIQEYQYALYIPESINYISQDLGNARGIKVIGLREFPEGHYVIDTSGIFLDDELVNKDASVHPPVQITNKLREAQLITKMQESYSLASVGYDDVTVEAVEHFDNYFGVNKWWIKSNDPNAMQGRGVYAGEFVKNKLSQNPDFWKEYDASDLFVQRALDTPPNPNVLSNIKILKDREIRVHVITSPVDGSVSVLPFSTFWKINDRAAGVSDMTPIVIENEDIREAHRVAVETIESAPDSDKRGQMYGADLVKLSNGSWGFVEANATEESALSGFFVMNALSHDSYMAALMGERPIHAEMAMLAHESLLADGAQSLVNESSNPARKPTFTPDVERTLDQLQVQANKALNQDIESTLKQSKPESKLRGNRPDLLNRTPVDLEYQVQHQSEPILKAMEVLSKHGLWKVLDAFMEQSHAAIVRRFNIAEQSGPAGEPDTVMAALRQQTLVQLHNILDNLTRENDSRTREARSWLKDQFSTLEKLNSELGTSAGQVSSLSGRVFKIMNGARAVMDYFEMGANHLMKVLGKKGEAFVNGEFAREVNALRAKYMGKAMNSSQMLALMAELNKRIHTRQYQKDARATLAANDQRVRNVAKSSAAKAAEHVSMDELGQEWADAVSKRMVKMMNGLPRGAEKLSELELFNRTVSQMVRENAEQAGLLGESIKNAPTIVQQFAVIINNEALYREFTNTLVNKMLSEYKPEPGSEFAKQVLEFRDQMANHLWRDGLVTSLVNEKLKQYQLSLSEIIKSHIKDSGGRNYVETHELVDRMRDDVREMMEREGVQNEGLLNQMLEDVESNLRAQIEQKRLDFLGGTTGGREFLQRMKTTLGEKAKQHALSNTSMFGELHSWLSDDLGIPDDMAQAIAQVMDQQLGKDIQAEREAIVQRRIDALKETLPDKQKKQVDMAMKKLLTAVNLGVMRDEEAYNAFAKPFGLPPWNPEVAAQADKLGEAIATAPNERIRNGFEKELADLMASQQAISPYDMFISAMYANILSGPSTHLVNIVSNAGSLMGYVATNIAQNPRRVPTILSALWRAALGEAQTETREAFWTGHSFTKNTKFFRGPNPLEITSPNFESKRSSGKLKEIEERAAELTHQLYSALGAKYVGRSLLAADVFFYKMAQEASFAAKVGDQSLVNQTMWQSARMAAREDLRKIGVNPDESKSTRRRAESLSYKILNDMRLQDSRTGLVDDNLREAWLSSHQEALDATFQQDPKGLLGKLAKVIETWTETKGDEVNPIGKLLIPFTRVAANVTNQMLEWTPYGLIRFGVGHTFGEDFRIKDDKGNVIKRDTQIATRAILGTGAMMIIYAMLANQDEDDPWLALYADGPKNAEAKRQLLDRGWKPNSLKVGNSYISYIPTPFAIAFSIVGRMWDDHRDGQPLDPLNMSAASVAILRAVTNQSFLASVTDFMAAVDSPEPGKRLSRVMARIVTVPIPNLAQQVDKWIDPSIQQANGFVESVIKNMPVVRHGLQPMLNVFGEPVHRTPGLGFIPGMERFITMERGDDPIYNVLGEKRIVVPGFSKSAKLGDNVMTQEQFYEYVQTAGPLVKQAIEADLPRIRQMSREDAQEHIEKIASDTKKRVRQQMRSTLVN